MLPASATRRAGLPGNARRSVSVMMPLGRLSETGRDDTPPRRSSKCETEVMRTLDACKVFADIAGPTLALDGMHVMPSVLILVDRQRRPVECWGRADLLHRRHWHKGEQRSIQGRGSDVAGVAWREDTGTDERISI